MALNHGGRLGEASRRYGIAENHWLDLSTGIAPWSYPVPEVPDRVWARLPEAEDGLIAAAADYYRTPADAVTALPGSQFAIRELPRVIAAHRGSGRVGVPAVGYAEHGRAWAAAGHEIVTYDDLPGLSALSHTLDHAVVITPNNPTGERADIERLCALAHGLGRRNGLLLVDAAFADCNDGLDHGGLPANALVLRSLGKFFGLAGLRLGFMIGRGPAATALHEQLQPWGVSHPARWIGRHALVDRAWQAGQHRRIIDSSRSLVELLDQHFSYQVVASAGLFASVFFDDDERAGRVHTALAEQAIWTRLGDDGRWLRFGLPGGGSAAARLDAALNTIAIRELC